MASQSTCRINLRLSRRGMKMSGFTRHLAISFFDAPLLMSTPSKKSLKAQRCLSKRKQCLLVHFGEMDSI